MGQFRTALAVANRAGRPQKKESIRIRNDSQANARLPGRVDVYPAVIIKD
jgi:hypothetical protein